MIDKRKIIRETLESLPDGHPLVFTWFCDSLRARGRTYLSYRIELWKYLDRQGTLFGPDGKARSRGSH